MNKNSATSEDQLEELRKKKQLFLRNEIVELGYDPIAFQNHMENLKSGGEINISL